MSVIYLIDGIGDGNQLDAIECTAVSVNIHPPNEIFYLNIKYKIIRECRIIEGNNVWFSALIEDKNGA